MTKKEIELRKRVRRSIIKAMVLLYEEEIERGVDLVIKVGKKIDKKFNKPSK
jgi:hypothetical protein